MSVVVDWIENGIACNSEYMISFLSELWLPLLWFSSFSMVVLSVEPRIWLLLCYRKKLEVHDESCVDYWPPVQVVWIHGIWMCCLCQWTNGDIYQRSLLCFDLRREGALSHSNHTFACAHKLILDLQCRQMHECKGQQISSLSHICSRTEQDRMGEFHRHPKWVFVSLCWLVLLCFAP